MPGLNPSPQHRHAHRHAHTQTHTHTHTHTHTCSGMCVGRSPLSPRFQAPQWRKHQVLEKEVDFLGDEDPFCLRLRIEQRNIREGGATELSRRFGHVDTDRERRRRATPTPSLWPPPPRPLTTSSPRVNMSALSRMSAAPSAPRPPLSLAAYGRRGHKSIASAAVSEGKGGGVGWGGGGGHIWW